MGTFICIVLFLFVCYLIEKSGSDVVDFEKEVDYTVELVSFNKIFFHNGEYYYREHFYQNTLKNKIYFYSNGGFNIRKAFDIKYKEYLDECKRQGESFIKFKSGFTFYIYGNKYIVSNVPPVMSSKQFNE